jgi:tryptophanyl-tRNA synthetase
MITPLPWLERVPTYKGKMEEIKDKDLNTYGFLGYPVLQAADILIYKPDFVPVGRDQLPHLELTREIVRRFNNFYGTVFPEPQEKLTEFPLVPGTDGRKMSKSYGNTIAISDPPEIIFQKITSMITDPARIKKNDPGHPEICSVFAFHKIYSAVEWLQIEKKCCAGSIGCVECKKDLAEKITLALEPIQQKRQLLERNPEKIAEILRQGASRARIFAGKTLEEVKRAINLL